MAAKNRKASEHGRDIADGFHAERPSDEDLEIRQQCRLDLRRFLEVYFPQSFTLAWSSDHLKVIERLQAVVLEGGLFAVAMPRGSGKTTLCERTALWATLYGHRRFVCIIGATEQAAASNLATLKVELEFNEQLRQPFRGVVYPVRRLENQARRAVGQLFAGEQTRLGWTAQAIQFPTMPDAAFDGLVNVSGAKISVVGLTGALRGQKATLPDGSTIRPDLALLDDPQTRESAMSSSQTANRVSIVNGDVLGLAGPGTKISCLMPCTVIERDDMADQLLDRERNPQWQGIRTRAVQSWPTDEKIWQTYRQIREDAMRKGHGEQPATDFYAKHRDAMDAGAEISWPQRKGEKDLSALQHFMNLRYDLGDEAFFAEYQNEPIIDDAGELHLSAARMMQQCSGRKRGEVPLSCDLMTAFIDVQRRALYWAVMAWQRHDDDADGYVVDYGIFPKQSARYVHYRDLNQTLAKQYPGAGVEGSIQSGLVDLLDGLLLKPWKVSGGGSAMINRVLVDSGHLPNIVAAACTAIGQANVQPAKGVGIRASSKPMSTYKRKPGERHGWHWYQPNVKRTREWPHVLVDVNHWKTFLHSRLLLTMGDRGAISLPGQPGDSEHRLLAEQVADSETYTVTEGHGRQVLEWKLKPAKPDNHWLDCLVGCCAAASIEGATFGPEDRQRKQSRGKGKRISLSQIQQERRSHVKR